MKLKRIFNNKKGAVLEMSIFFMLIVFTFCTLLVTMTLISRSRIKLEKAYYNIDLNNEQYFEQQIAEDLLFYLDDKTIPQNAPAEGDPNQQTPLVLIEKDEGGNVTNIKFTDELKKYFTPENNPSETNFYSFLGFLASQNVINEQPTIPAIYGSYINDSNDGDTFTITLDDDNFSEKLLRLTLTMNNTNTGKYIEVQVEVKVDANNNIIKTITKLDKSA